MSESFWLQADNSYILLITYVMASYLLVERGQNHIPQNQRFRRTVGPPGKTKECWSTNILCKDTWRYDWSLQLNTELISSCERKAWKIFGRNGNRAHGIWDTGTVLYDLYQLSYQASWELATVWVRIISGTDQVTAFSAVLRRCPIYSTNEAQIMISVILLVNWQCPGRARTNYLKRTFSYSGAFLWNLLPGNIRDIKSIAKFKTQTKRVF